MTSRTILDLSKRHFAQAHGDITVIGTWILNDERQYRPCLVLVPTHRPVHNERTTPCIVTLDTAYLWSEDELGDPRHCASQSIRFAQAMGMSHHNPFTCMRISGLIRDHILDLLKIPPRPTTDKMVVADALAVDPATGRERHMEIRDHV